MIYYIFFIAALTLFYLLVQTLYAEGWRALPTWEAPAGYAPKTKISVLIPARNEAEQIVACLTSVLSQTYPAAYFEVIVLDDFSDDATPDLVRQMQATAPNLHLICLADHISPTDTQSFKKKAIALGIAQASGELIVTTDADCLVPSDWLRLLASLYEATGAKFIAAPVNFHQERNDFERFQSLDFTGMMGITGAGIHTRIMRMCNGANLAYPKVVFEAVGGFQGIDDKASGDDMMLMQKVARHFPTAIFYLKNKNATVLTTAKPTLQAFLQQRIRWSTKSSGYEERQVTAILGGVWLFCVTIILNLLLSPIFGVTLLAVAAAQFLLKAAADYRLLRRTTDFFGRQDLMAVFWKSSVYHLLYIVMVGFLGGVLKKYEWKGRTVR